MRLQDRREPHSERSLVVHGICMQVLTSGILHLHFCQDLLPKKMEFLKFPDLREEDAVLDS